MRAIHRGGPLDCAGRGHPLEPAIDRESPAVWARRGHGASNLLKRGEGVISWWQPLATTVAAERALLSSLRSADPATFDTQLRAQLLGREVPGCGDGVGSSVEASHLQGTGTRDHVCVWRARGSIGRRNAFSEGGPRWRSDRILLLVFDSWRRCMRVEVSNPPPAVWGSIPGLGIGGWDDRTVRRCAP